MSADDDDGGSTSSQFEIAVRRREAEAGRPDPQASVARFNSAW